ncbi:MAG: hypothetical protein ACW986_19275 [Promethearchaeota archaeon]
MDKYEKSILALVLMVVGSSIVYLVVTIFGNFDTSFPFFSIFPGSVIIFIPIIAQRRREELEKRNRLKQNLGV